MRSPQPLLAASLLFSACTWNVVSHVHELTETSAVPFTAVHLDAFSDGSWDSAPITVRGSTRSDALARARLTALQQPGSSSMALAEGWSLAWNAYESGAIALQILTPPDGPAWLDALGLEVPSATPLVLNTGRHALDVSGLDARVDVEATSGAMNVETSDVVNLRTSSGSIEVVALAGVIEGDSGSVDFTFGDWVRAQTTSGSIDGEMGDGGSVQSNSGSIDLRLTRPLTRDLRVENRSGSIDLDVPRDMPCTLEVTNGSGSVDVDLGSVQEHGGGMRIDVAGGGPLLQVMNESGSITITSH